MVDPYNPYAAPVNYGQAMPMQAPMRVADLGKRFLGAVVDGLVGIPFIVPGYVLMVISSMNDPETPPPLFFVGLALTVVGGLALLILQIYFLATRSQSIGKVVMKTQIVDVNTGQPADLVHTLLLRSFVNGLIGAIPCIGPIYSLVDICFIFREDRRCIHDLIANTVVIDIG